MTDTPANVPLEVVKAAERQEIMRRRRTLGIPEPAECGDVIGVAMSGGGIRAASFCLGVTQRFLKSGFWRFVDYLSTVSGGGYLGGLLTTLVLKGRVPWGRDNCPLTPQHNGKQPPIAMRQILGGHQLLSGWDLLNRYLIGLLLLNATLFSGIVAICALAAFAWRCLDYPWFRERVGLLGLNSDLYAPFFPAVILGVAWLCAWVLSMWRQGSQAPGRIARRLLGLLLLSVLTGFALLLGNGDISVNALDTLFGRKAASGGSGIAGWLIALVLGGLLPFLSPRRLVQSGLNRERKWWEKYIFAVSSTALLLGLPIVLVGFFARENISGYNTHPHRPIVKEDIEDWSRMVAVILPDPYENLSAAQGPLIHELRLAISRLDPGFSVIRRAKSNAGDSDRGGSAGADKPSASNNPANGNEAPLLVRLLATAKVENESRSLHKILSTFHKRTDNVDSMAQASRTNALRSWRADWLEYARNGKLPTNWFSTSPKKWTADELNQSDRWLSDFQQFILTGKSDTRLFVDLKRNAFEVEWKSDQKTKDEAMVRYLCYLAIALHKAQLELQYDLTDIHAIGSWESGIAQVAKHRGYRLLSVLNWWCGFDTDPSRNEVAAYWQESLIADALKDEICRILNEYILAQPQLLEDLVTLRQDAELEKSDKPQTLNSAMIDQLKRARATDVTTWLPYERRELTRTLLEEGAPGIFRPRSEIRRRVTIFEDQYTRLRYAGAAGIVFVVLGFLVNVNATTLHRYYRNRLERGFLVPRSADSPVWALTDLETTTFGAPYHLINASVGLIALQTDKNVPTATATEDDHFALGQRVAPFVFSQRYCGSSMTGYVASEQFAAHVVDLADAIALSGAAVSPGQVNNPLLAFLMFILNLRLGQWLPNPRRTQRIGPPQIPTVLRDLSRSLDDRRYCFVTDGGYSDNLGLLALLDRRCRLMIVIDTSQDPKHEFDDLAHCLRWARIESGIRFVKWNGPTDLDLAEDWMAEELRFVDEDIAKEKGISRKHYSFARVIYPETTAPAALLIYIKPSFDGDEGLDLRQYRAANAEFPHETTNDQLFEADQVESYRQLGFHIASELIDQLKEAAGTADFWQQTDVTAERVQEWLSQLEKRSFQAEEPAAAVPAKKTVGRPPQPR